MPKKAAHGGQQRSVDMPAPPCLQQYLHVASSMDLSVPGTLGIQTVDVHRPFHQLMVIPSRFTPSPYSHLLRFHTPTLS